MHQAIGYRELWTSPSVDDALARTMVRTRQFARRQLAWFRRDPRIRWIGTARNPAAVAAVVLALWGRNVATVAADRP